MAINHDKDCIGTTVEFLSIELDTILMQARLPDEKLQETKTRVKAALQKFFLSRNELEFLMGFLLFAAKVVVPGRAFLQRLFNKLTNTWRAFVHLNQKIKADLLWWHHFLPKWNGIRMIRPCRPIFQLWTDASGIYGMGAYILKDQDSLYSILHQQVLTKRFTTRLRAKHINVKEMTAILHALQKWLSMVTRSYLILYCDNFAVATGVKKTSIRGNAMHALHTIVMIAALNDIEIESRWISTRQNAVADWLSRRKLQKIADKYLNLQDITTTKSQFETLLSLSTTRLYSTKTQQT